MEKKRTIISLIFVAVVVASAVALIIFSGITAKDYNYVQLEINPKVEFLCDNNFKVVSVKALNEDAKIVLSDLDYTGLDIDMACVDFIDQCAQTGFIDVNGSNNACNITIIDGITQALDVHVTKEVFSYLKRNEILCAVIENYEDRGIAEEKKKHSVDCSNKYKLIKTLNEQDSTLKIEQLKKLNEENLIDMVNNIHTTQNLSIDESYKIKKQELLNNNLPKYNKHKKVISNSSQKSFSELYDKYNKLASNRYALDFSQEYSNWQKQTN